MVGDATERQLEGSPVVSKVVGYDKVLGFTDPFVLKGCDFIFVCVPSYVDDLSAVDDAVLNAASMSNRIVIRSTLPLGQTKKYMEEYPANRLCFMPEFFRERSRVDDALHPDKLVFGVEGSDLRMGEETAALFRHLYSHVELITSTTAAEMIKLSINAYYTTRIVLANQLFDIAKAHGVGWEEVRTGLYADKRIDPSGFDILLDGFRGAGGKCLPKDLDMTISAASAAGIEVPMLEAVRDVNNALLGGEEY